MKTLFTIGVFTSFVIASFGCNKIINEQPEMGPPQLTQTQSTQLRPMTERELEILNELKLHVERSTNTDNISSRSWNDSDTLGNWIAGAIEFANSAEETNLLPSSQESYLNHFENYLTAHPMDSIFMNGMIEEIAIALIQYGVDIVKNNDTQTAASQLLALEAGVLDQTELSEVAKMQVALIISSLRQIEEYLLLNPELFVGGDNVLLSTPFGLWEDCFESTVEEELNVLVNWEEEPIDAIFAWGNLPSTIAQAVANGIYEASTGGCN